jgi:hypothetical protein
MNGYYRRCPVILISAAVLSMSWIGESEDGEVKIRTFSRFTRYCRWEYDIVLNIHISLWDIMERGHLNISQRQCK